MLVKPCTDIHTDTWIFHRPLPQRKGGQLKGGRGRPDIEGDGDNSVKGNEVREEDEDGYHSGPASLVCRHDGVPWQIHLEVVPSYRLPNSTCYCCDQTHQHQEEHNLETEKEKQDRILLQVSQFHATRKIKSTSTWQFKHNKVILPFAIP